MESRSNHSAVSLVPDRRQYQTLDGLRGVAALGIVILHTPHFFGRGVLPYSFLSVDFFFILSGFVLASAYEERLVSGMTAVAFLRVRMIRLFPLYLLGTLLGVPVALMAMKHGGNGLSVEWSPHLFVTSLPFSMLMLPTVRADGVLFPFNPVFWSIFFEVVVNVLYAMLARYLSDTRTLSVMVGISALAVLAYVLQADSLDVGGTWDTVLGGAFRTIFGFFCGVLIFRVRRPVKINSSIAALALLTLLVVLLGIPHTIFSALATVLVLFPLVVLVSSAVEPGTGLQRAFRLLGTTSYASYALHKPLYQILLGLLIVGSPVSPEALVPWIGIGFVVLLFAGCVVVDRVYDAPMRRFLGSLQRKAQAFEPGR